MFIAMSGHFHNVKTLRRDARVGCCVVGMAFGKYVLDGRLHRMQPLPLDNVMC